MTTIWVLLFLAASGGSQPVFHIFHTEDQCRAAAQDLNQPPHDTASPAYHCAAVIVHPDDPVADP